MWGIKDKENSLHQLEILFNSIGISIDYETTMLIDMAYKLHSNKRGDVKLSDMMELKQKHSDIITNYYNKQKNKENETNSK